MFQRRLATRNNIWFSESLWSLPARNVAWSYQSNMTSTRPLHSVVASCDWFRFCHLHVLQHRMNNAIRCFKRNDFPAATWSSPVLHQSFQMLVVRRPIRESNFGGLTRQVGRHMLDGFWGCGWVNISILTSGGVMFAPTVSLHCFLFSLRSVWTHFSFLWKTGLHRKDNEQSHEGERRTKLQNAHVDETSASESFKSSFQRVLALTWLMSTFPEPVALVFSLRRSCSSGK